MLSIEDIVIGRKLAEGKTCSVYLAKIVNPEPLSPIGEYYFALKTINKHDVRGFRQRKQLKREIEIHSRLRHRNIIRAYTYFWDTYRVYIVQEYAPKGDLFGLLRKHGRLADGTVAKMIGQVIDALRYCHRHKVIHRDIKPENILVSYRDQIKLTDFGGSIQTEQMRRTLCGTMAYLPPEMARRQPYDHRADLWCLGVLTYELLAGVLPFSPSPEIKTANDYRRHSIPEHLVTPFAKDFIERLLKINPEERMSLEECRNHSWIRLLYHPSSSIDANNKQ